MGLYDREYYRQDRPGFSLGGPRTVVGLLILVNVVVYLADAVFTGEDHAIQRTLALTPNALLHPLSWWKFLTYGFAHDVHPAHIILNMLGLFFLGPDLESTYGKREFLRIYLFAIFIGGLVWAAANQLQDRFGSPINLNVPLIGASGAIVAVVILYALNFPHRTVLLLFVIPVPAWFAGLLLVAFDLYGRLVQPDSHIAYGVHLAGAAFAFLYFRLGWNFGKLLPERWTLRLRRRPRLRVHTEEDEGEEGDALAAEVDRILEKISREGESSLTRKERRVLQNASKQYQRRRRGGEAD